MGIGYVIDNYISYFQKRQKEKAYQIYVTDALKLIAENTSKISGGSYLSKRYIDVIEPHIEKRTAKEVIGTIKDKLNRM